MPFNFKMHMDRVVIGSSLEAVLYAFFNKCKIIYTVNQQPQKIEIIEDFGLGTDPLPIWNKYMFLLGVGGNNPFDNRVKHLRYDDNNTIKVITNEESVVEVSYGKLFIFEDHNFLDLPPSTKVTNDEIRIIDWFKVKKGQFHPYEHLEQNSKFMKHVVFYPGGSRKDSRRKDVYVVSYCKRKELDKYPEHLVRIKTEALMRSYEIDKITSYQKNIVIEHDRRDIKEYGKNLYENFDNVEFIYDDAKLIYELGIYKTRKIDYMKYFELKTQL